jgi:hypothetical protein
LAPALDPPDAATAPQIAFHQRVYPPLPPPPLKDLTDTGSQHWDELLQQRRLCFAILHKLNNRDDIRALPAADRVKAPRSFTIYYVTLRRGQSTHRYFRQDPGDDVVSDPKVPRYGPAEPGDEPMDLEALDAEEDVMFPVAWRVQITLVDANPADPAEIGMPGVPSQATVEGKVAGTELLLAEMMPRGSYLIDELTGDLYHVANYELSQSAPYESALLTFDEAIAARSLDETGNSTDGNNGVVDDEERLRTVWVYPPAVERDANGQLVGFAGPQPVVGIEVRTMDFWP